MNHVSEKPTKPSDKHTKLSGRQTKKSGKQKKEKEKKTESSAKPKKTTGKKRSSKNKISVKGRNRSGLHSQNYDQGYNHGYDKGYDTGFQKAMEMQNTDQQNAYDKGYEKGLYDAGDGIVDQLLPGLTILPEFSVREIIAAGLEKLKPYFTSLLHPSQIFGELEAALRTNVPMSVVRLGDGELLTLAQEVVYDPERIKKEGAFLSYAGVNIPDLSTRDHLVQAINEASIIGIPKLRLPNFQPLMFSVFRAHGIDFRRLRLTDSTINYMLYQHGYYSKLLPGRRVLIVGNMALPLRDVLVNHGINVIDAITPVEGVKDIPRVMAEISLCDFDIALVASGVAAVIITQRIASELGKVALDFGHLADSLARGEIPFQ